MSSVAEFRRQNAELSIDWSAIASVAASVIYAVYIHHYVLRLERIGCACAADFRRAYIQWFTLALIIIGAINIALRLTGGELGLTLLSMILSPIMVVATVIYIVFVLQYVNRLRREKCQCSEGMTRAILYIITIIHVTLACLLSLVTLFSVLTAVASVKGRGGRSGNGAGPRRR